MLSSARPPPTMKKTMQWDGRSSTSRPGGPAPILGEGGGIYSDHSVLTLVSTNVKGNKATTA